MTKSEQICNELGAKFFCKDFVYENLKYFNEQNNKVELCDGLFAYSDMYVVLQIKERSSLNGGKTAEKWLDDVIYRKAVDQMIKTVEILKSKDLIVNDFYHQKSALNKSNILFPVIIFDNDDITKYKRCISCGTIDINVFSLSDFKAMMNVLIHPYDIIFYLQERINWLKNNGSLPNLIVGENDNSTIIAKICDEESFATFFELYIYDGKINKKEDSLKLLSIINNFRKNQIKINNHYKIILNILQNISPRIATGFIERFQYAWDNACKNNFDFTKAIQIQYNNVKTSIVFFSIGTEKLKSQKYYEVLCDAKQLQHKSDAILVISFVGNKKDTCEIDWVYFEQEFIEDAEALKMYETLGFYNGIINRELYEKICAGALQI